MSFVVYFVSKVLATNFMNCKETFDKKLAIALNIAIVLTMCWNIASVLNK
jgi:hypothetical protein